MEATLMKVFGVISTTALLLMLGATIPAYAQEEHHEESAKPEKQEAAKPAQHEEQAKPARQQEAAKPAKQEAAAKPARQQEQAKPEKQQEQAKSAKQEPAAKPARQAAAAKSEKQPRQTQQAKQETRGGNAGGQQHAQRTAAEQQRQRAVPALRLSARTQNRIPDDRFRSNFGREHSFRIGRPTMVGGYSRFQYGGFWFGFVQPWPDGWYYTDDVYVDYIDGGYYLCNPYYPGAQVAISVVL
jgi:outer membrane biosynthesis protein TonB